ncbi:hypothetical protein HQ520_11950, partial [bacterium]|nr:hypothetical protein [bacterium]
MQIRKFYASNLPAAIRDVRRTLGPDAVILSTRNLSSQDAAVIVNGGRATVEVTAAREPAEAAPPKPVASRRLGNRADKGAQDEARQHAARQASLRSQ